MRSVYRPVAPRRTGENADVLLHCPLHYSMRDGVCQAFLQKKFFGRRPPKRRLCKFNNYRPKKRTNIFALWIFTKFLRENWHFYLFTNRAAFAIMATRSRRVAALCTVGRRPRGASILWRQRVRFVFSAVHFLCVSGLSAPGI